MIRFGHRIEPLVDDYLIDETHNLIHRLHQPKDCGKVIGFDAPWEGPGSLGMTVLDDNGTVKCYYRGFPSEQSDESERQTSCLSVSEDGLHFTPYPINEISYNGIRENNIIRMDSFCHNFAPFYDTNPNCRPEDRYKAIGGTMYNGGIHVFGSPDGIHWHSLHDGPVITRGLFDSMNMAFYNPATGLYHCYSRYWYSPEKDYASDDKTYSGFRAIQTCTSEDFIHWSDPVENQYAEGHPKDELYTNAARPIPGAEHIMLSIPMRFHPTRKKITDFDRNTHGSEGISDAVFMTSRDGVYWERRGGGAWLSGSLNPHEWTQRCFIVAGGIVARGDDFYFYVEKNYMWDDDGLWAYSLPRYRFLSYYADEAGGTLTTKPLLFETDVIHINFATSAYGSVQVTVLDYDGTPIAASDEIYGNELSYPLTFDGLAGRTGRLCITLKEAHLYALGAPMV